jgi:hypothetical protein
VSPLIQLTRTERNLINRYRRNSKHRLNRRWHGRLRRNDDRKFFATKLEVVHVFKHKDKTVKEGFIVAHSKRDIDFWLNEPCYDHLGTITGPIVPPEKESGVVK